MHKIIYLPASIFHTTIFFSEVAWPGRGLAKGSKIYHEQNSIMRVRDTSAIFSLVQKIRDQKFHTKKQAYNSKAIRKDLKEAKKIYISIPHTNTHHAAVFSSAPCFSDALLIDDFLTLLLSRSFSTRSRSVVDRRPMLYGIHG